MVQGALKDIQVANIWGGPTVAYAKAFGAYDQQRGQTVENNLQSINGALQGTLTFNSITPSDPNYSTSLFAYVTIGVPGVINLGPAYWQASPVGTDSQAGTIVHEVSHLVAGTQDYAYGQNALQLATTNPGKAIQNADNYEYYAESFP